MIIIYVFTEFSSSIISVFEILTEFPKCTFMICFKEREKKKYLYVLRSKLVVCSILSSASYFDKDHCLKLFCFCLTEM